MSEEIDSKNISNINYGINAGGSIEIINGSGQLAIGKNITQLQNSSAIDIEKLKKSLLAFREELTKLDLSSENQDIINGNISASLKEIGKDKPKLPIIKSQVINIVETLKDSALTVKNISELCGSLKIIAGMFGLSL